MVIRIFYVDLHLCIAKINVTIHLMTLSFLDQEECRAGGGKCREVNILNLALSEVPKVTPTNGFHDGKEVLYNWHDIN